MNRTITRRYTCSTHPYGQHLHRWRVTRAICNGLKAAVFKLAGSWDGLARERTVKTASGRQYGRMGNGEWRRIDQR